MSEQYKAHESQPERTPVITIDDLADAVERRRTDNKAEKRIERAERSIDFVMQELGVPSTERIQTAQKIQERLSERVLAGLPPARPHTEVHPRGWLGELEDRQG